MQVFICDKNVLDIAKAMWSDQKRYNKQIVECGQILKAIIGETKAWANHPVCLMYKEHKEWLECYMKCFEAYRHYMRVDDNTSAKLIWEYECLFQNEEANKLTPPFIDEPMQIQHRKRLYTKAPQLYPQFEKYGTSEENWYFVNNEIVKYVNGKRVK